MRLLVTGCSGFLGSVLVPLLQSRGHFVIGVDREPEFQSNLFFQTDLEQGLPENLGPIDACIHLASRVGGFLFNASESEIEVAEARMLQHLSDRLGRKVPFIYTSSIAVFESSGVQAESKREILDQRTFYGRAKAAGERWIERNFDRFSILRPTNYFGPGQPAKDRRVGRSHVIPELIRKIESDSELTLEILGDGQQRRNFVHIEDVARLLALILEREFEPYVHVRSEILISIQELAETLMEWCDRRKPLTFRPEFTSLEPFPLHLFPLEAAKRLGWKPRIQNLCEGLEARADQHKSLTRQA